jgi:uncharacterized membrane protein YhaH (DUF805 family)
VGPIVIAAALSLFLPNVAVSMRRLHDIHRTGYWVLLIVTIIGIVPLLYWALQAGTVGDNDYGPDPLAGGSTAGHPQGRQGPPISSTDAGGGQLSRK